MSEKRGFPGTQKIKKKLDEVLWMCAIQKFSRELCAGNGRISERAVLKLNNAF